MFFFFLNLILFLGRKNNWDKQKRLIVCFLSYGKLLGRRNGRWNQLFSVFSGFLLKLILYFLSNLSGVWILWEWCFTLSGTSNTSQSANGWISRTCQKHAQIIFHPKFKRKDIYIYIYNKRKLNIMFSCYVNCTFITILPPYSALWTNTCTFC